MEPLPGIRRRPGILAFFDRESGYVYHRILPAQFAGFFEQFLTAVDVRGVKHPGGQFGFRQYTPDQ